MTSIPKLGQYVNDEIYLEVHKLKTDKIIREYHEKYKISSNKYNQSICTFRGLSDRKNGRIAINYRYTEKGSPIYPPIYKIFAKGYYYTLAIDKRTKIPLQIPKRYWYTSGKNSQKGYFD